MLSEKPSQVPNDALACRPWQLCVHQDTSHTHNDASACP